MDSRYVNKLHCKWPHFSTTVRVKHKGKKKKKPPSDDANLSEGADGFSRCCDFGCCGKTHMKM